MVAPRKPTHRCQSHTIWRAAFLAMVPTIRAMALFAFRHLRPEAKENVVDEVKRHIAHNCWIGLSSSVDGIVPRIVSRRNQTVLDLFRYSRHQSLLPKIVVCIAQRLRMPRHAK